MIKSKIQWTDNTWNCIRGCSRVSKGCEHCYAERVAHRFSGEGEPYEGLTVIGNNGKPRWSGEIKLVEEHLLDPLRWKKPSNVFVNSMSDVFHENVPERYINKIFAVMALAPQHNFQLLTKRPKRMLEYLSGELLEDVIYWCYEYSAKFKRKNTMLSPLDFEGLTPQGIAEYIVSIWPRKNIWLGISCEDQQTADERIPLLLQTPGAIRWISAEPLLGPIDLSAFLSSALPVTDDNLDAPDGAKVNGMRRVGSNWEREIGLDWVVIGGESGYDARPFDPQWALDIVRDCKAANVPVFVKQLGSNPIGLKLKDKKGGDINGWPEELRVREYPTTSNQRSRVDQ